MLLLSGVQVKRLDRSDLLAHFRKHGPRNTYLASTCNVYLPTGDKAKLVYILPKFTVRFAMEKHDDMRAVLQLSLAQDVAAVEAACAHAKTSTYDLQRHQYLRQTYVSVWVAEGGKVLDSHRDFVSGAGMTEHTLFISGLLVTC